MRLAAKYDGRNITTMSDTVVMLHGSANGSYSWGAVKKLLAQTQQKVLAPDMLGYGRAPAPSGGWTIDEETRHLVRALAPGGDEPVHLVAHSLGAMFALHLMPALGQRVRRLTLIDPVVVSVLRQTGERAAYGEMEAQYERFMARLDVPAAAAEIFVEHWSGDGSWAWLGHKARAVITSLVPKIEREMRAARADETPLAALIASRPDTPDVVGEETRIAPLATGRQLARALGGRTIVVPGAGHMLPLTHPEAVVAAIAAPAREPNATAERVASHG